MKNFAGMVALVVGLGFAAQVHAAPTVSVAQVTTDTLTLAVQPVGTDLINGTIATTIASQGTNNGWHSAAPADDNTNKAVLTNGNINDPGALAALQWDNNGANANPTISFFYALASGGDTATIDSVHVFSQWQDGRVFYTYDLYSTTDDPPTAGGTWTLVLDDIRPADFGDGHPQPGTQAVGLTVVEDDGSGSLVTGITGLRFDFYSGGNTVNGFNPPATAAEGSWVREIDVEGVIVPAASVRDWNLMN